MPRPGLSIRAKVALLSTLLLAIPYVGYRYVREMESYLREGQEAAVIGAARALAGALHDRPDLLGPQLIETTDAPALYVHPLRAPMQIDGYASDWEGYREWMEPLAGADGADGGARFVAGEYGPYLYLLVEVRDGDVVYQPGPEPSVAPTSDRVRLTVRDPHGARHAWVLTTSSPGWVSAYEVRDAGEEPTMRLEARIRAEWQQSAHGYTLEVRVPLALTGPDLGIAVDDVDRGTARVRVLRGPGPGRDGLAPLLLPSEAIDGLIRSLGRTPGRRVWVIDRRARVVARGGHLEPDTPPPPINPLFALVLRPPDADVFVDEPVLARLRGPEIDAALAGRSASRWREVRGTDGVFVLSAAYPIWHGRDVAGAVVVEETSLGIQTVRRQALANLFTTTLVVCLVGGLVLLLFATRISVRLGRLRDEAEHAIDSYGRVVGRVSESRARDEIGSLARSFAAMTDRLREYNSYLEQLARRLSHELRTPITVVRSSLESLTMGDAEVEPQVYVERAREGLARLDSIISRMSEASRLEHAIAAAEPETFDLAEVVAAAVDAYRATWPDTPIELDRGADPCPVVGAPDLTVQMLDKLVANAREFRRGEGPVVVRVHRHGARVVLAVENPGPPLPAGMQSALFESMVSMREGKAAGGPHLGLGLYIVRLVTEFHRGSVRAEDLPGGVGVRVVVELPTATPPRRRRDEEA